MAHGTNFKSISHGIPIDKHSNITHHGSLQFLSDLMCYIYPMQCSVSYIGPILYFLQTGRVSLTKVA